MNKDKTVIIIVGPTASGKTDFSLKLADHFKTSIISADSRQCFKELNIGVAKPPEEALYSIKHYFINSHSIHDNINAHVFEEYALKAAKEIFIQNDVAIMVGGTGMYIKAFCEGFDEMPEVDVSIRKEIIKNYNEKGLLWLQEEVQKKDPEFWKQAEQKNPRRLMRALEVLNGTDKSINDFKQKERIQRPFKVIKIGIEILKDQLHNNIHKRVDQMIEQGLINEARLLLPFKSLNALQTVGYKEVFDYFDGTYSLEKATEKIKFNTCQYAKRQLTWFKKDSCIKWIDINTSGKQNLTYNNFINAYFKA